MTSVQDFALKAARKYLQSIVFVDDEIYQPVAARAVEIDGPGGQKMQLWKPVVPSPEPAPSLRKASSTEAIPSAAAIRSAPAAAAPAEKRSPPVAAAAAKALSKQATEDAARDGALYHPKNLVESFARERMVCALYEPEKGFKTDSNSDVFKLCERADVVILDWEFHREPGKKVLSLVTGLINASQTTVPHHVRLIAIYTSTQNLKQIANQIFEHLKSSNLALEVDGEYALNSGSSRIAVLGKPTTGRSRDQVEAAQVAEVDLAQRIIAEFAGMHEGILPSVALHALANLRTNTKKILDKFRPELDGAFLVHRGLILPDDDAFEQIPELLAEEALAVMLATRIEDAEAKSMAERMIDDLKVQTAFKDKEGNATAVGTLAVKLLKEGPTPVKKKKVELGVENVGLLQGELDRTKVSSPARLAALYTSRTQYGDARYLEFGTICRYEATAGDTVETRYAICLMPLCDCVRLVEGQQYSFPFWDLRTDNQGAPSKGLVVERPSNEGFLELFCMGKPRKQLWMDDFSAGPSKMVSATGKEGSFFFEGTKRNLEWVAQLKPSHTQRIAHDIGNSFARVGVLEAEWLRLKAER